MTYSLLQAVGMLYASPLAPPWLTASANQLRPVDVEAAMRELGWGERWIG